MQNPSVKQNLSIEARRLHIRSGVRSGAKNGAKGS